MPPPTVLIGDCLDSLRTLPAGSVHCCVTSPPYWGLRDYGCDGQIGLEKTPSEFVEKMVAVFREVRRVLRDDGTCWVNLGDSYSVGKPKHSYGGDSGLEYENTKSRATPPCFKPKNLVGIPWRVAFALQADGWYLRQDIIWAKPNPMPESVRDRCTKAHEYIFLLTKSARYFYDAETVKESSYGHGSGNKTKRWGTNHTDDRSSGLGEVERQSSIPWEAGATSRNRRSVWTVATAPCKEAHFATFPPKLIEPCILAGTSEKGCCANCGAPWVRVVDTSYDTQGRTTNGPRSIERRHEKPGFAVRAVKNSTTTGWRPSCDCGKGTGNSDRDIPVPIPCTVLDPFGGSGTTAGVAIAHGRRAILCELNAAYAAMVPARVESIVAKLTAKPKGKKNSKVKINGKYMKQLDLFNE